MREGVRRIEAMTQSVKDLSDDELVGLAKHFSRLAPKPSGETVDASPVKRGAALAVSVRCGSCHLASLAVQQQMPQLAKQRIDYMTHAMKAFCDNRRSGADTAMTAAVIGIFDADLTALAHFTASQ